MNLQYFKDQLDTAYNLKFDFEDGEILEDCVIECAEFDINFEAYANTQTVIEQGDYVNPDAKTVYGQIEIFNAYVVFDDNTQKDLTKKMTEYLSKLLTETNI